MHDFHIIVSYVCKISSNKSVYKCRFYLSLKFLNAHHLELIDRFKFCNVLGRYLSQFYIHIEFHLKQFINAVFYLILKFWERLRVLSKILKIDYFYGFKKNQDKCPNLRIKINSWTFLPTLQKFALSLNHNCFSVTSFLFFN